MDSLFVWISGVYSISLHVIEFIQMQGSGKDFSLGNSAADRIMIFFLLPPEYRVWHLYLLPLGDSLHEISDYFWGKIKILLLDWIFTHHAKHLTLKTPRKPASENVVCLCRLLNILANFSNLFLHTGKQWGPRSDCS